MPLDVSNARQLQATQRAYEAARTRLSSAQQDDQVVQAGEDMLAAKKAHKAQVERCEMILSRQRDEERARG